MYTLILRYVLVGFLTIGVTGCAANWPDYEARKKFYETATKVFDDSARRQNELNAQNRSRCRYVTVYKNGVAVNRGNRIRVCD